eukprot:403375004
MEFDILNEILTGTVAQLFTDFSKHNNFMKTSSQMGQDKSEIPKQFDFYGSSLPTSQIQTETSKISDTGIIEWLQSDAKVKLQEAYRKLDLDNSKISGKLLITLTIEELSSEKKKVKNELKAYDLNFQRQFGRPPNRHEKEPMRHIYMYYKKLKQAITKNQTIGSSSMGNGNIAGLGTNGQQSMGRSLSQGARGSGSQNQRNGYISSDSTNQMGAGSIGGSSRGVSVSSSGSQQISGGYFSDSVSNPEEQNQKIEDDKQPQSQQSSSSHITQSPSELQVYLFKKYNMKNVIELQKKALELKQERRVLRVKLDKFQKEFETNHLRKIRYTRDIGPVAGDFKRYKDLKSEVQRFEIVLQSHEKQRGGALGNVHGQL